MVRVGPAGELVGRDRLMARLTGLVHRAMDGPGVSMLVSGEAGIGKTSLLRAAAAIGAGRGARTAWGTCLDAEGSPGYWPWTQALDGLVRGVGVDHALARAGDDAALLGTFIPSFPQAPGPEEVSERTRLLAMDAVTRFLVLMATVDPLLLIIDDLQWADESSLALFDVVARAARSARIGLFGAYRHDELPHPVNRRVGDLLTRSDHLHVEGLDLDAVRQLIELVTGHPVEPGAAEAIHRRSGGHPFFVRELALLAHGEGGATGEQLPAAVRDAINRRVTRLPEPTVAILETTAVAGAGLLPDVVAAVLDRSVVEVEDAARPAVEAGVLVRADDGIRFRHDLLRETLLDRVGPARRLALHQAVGCALQARLERGGQVAPSDLARHFTPAIALAGPERAVRWALRAAASEIAALAFDEAAGHLRRLRTAAVDAAVDLDPQRMIDVLVAEADALARAGHSLDARGLLRHAGEIADRVGDPEPVARVALAIAELGARFAVRRDDVIHPLQHALAAVAGADDLWEARLTATLARQLQHSVPEDRPRAGPLSQRALALGHRAGDPATLLSCLLARHDVLWTPGTADQRAEIAQEIAAVASAADDPDHHAEGLLLLATALLEQGSPAFQTALRSALTVLDTSRQPRHRYLAATRRACLALLHGRLEEAEQLIEDAAALGQRIREPDTANVHLGQRLELARARNDPGELRALAERAVDHWAGAPVHAHAMAAGFYARAGDLYHAARHLAAVHDLGTWRADRSYLWSMFIPELAQAAIAVQDHDLCRRLLDDLRPLTGTCGVAGALVVFTGSHAHTGGLLAAALGQPDTSRTLFDHAATAYRHLGATGWLTEVTACGAASSRPTTSTASMRRNGPVWQITFADRSATMPHSKGLADLARLLAVPGTEVHVLQLTDSADRSGPPGEVIDRTALNAYRQRLADLDAEIHDVGGTNDHEREARLQSERQALLDELRRVTGLGRRPRQFANHPAERARKAVTARIRDAIGRLDPVLPDLAAHLQQSIITGTYCRYRPGNTTWDIHT